MYSFIPSIIAQGRFATIIVAFALCFASSGPVRADVSDDIKTLLTVAQQNGDEARFRVILNTVLKAWPDDRISILAFVEGLQTPWLEPEQIEEIRIAEAEAEATEQAERDRGIFYYIDPKYWNPRVELGASASSGDTSETAVSFGFSMARDFDDWSHKLSIFADAARRQGVTTRERFTLNHESSTTLFGEFLAINQGLFEVDRFSGFNFRVTETLGLGYQLLDGDIHKLRVELGPGIRYSALDTVLAADGTRLEGGTRTELIGRGGISWSYQITPSLLLEDNAAFLQGTESTRFDNDFALSASLTDRLKARLRFQTIYESDVPIGTANWDTATRVTLVYDF